MGNEWKQNSPIAIMTVCRCSCNSRYYWSMNEGSDFILHKICFAAVLMQSSLCFQGKWTLLILVLKVSSCAAAVAVVMRRGKVFWPAAAVTSYNTVTSVSGTTFHSRLLENVLQRVLHDPQVGKLFILVIIIYWLNFFAGNDNFMI